MSQMLSPHFHHLIQPRRIHFGFAYGTKLNLNFFLICRLICDAFCSGQRAACHMTGCVLRLWLCRRKPLCDIKSFVQFWRAAGECFLRMPKFCLSTDNCHLIDCVDLIKKKKWKKKWALHGAVFSSKQRHCTWTCFVVCVFSEQGCKMMARSVWTSSLQKELPLSSIEPFS